MFFRQFLKQRLRALALAAAAAGCGEADLTATHGDPLVAEAANLAGSDEGQGGGLAEPGSASFALGLTPDFAATHGKGNFGDWKLDSFGLPSYAYVNGSAADNQAFQAERPYHLLGNSGSLTHSYSHGYHVLFSARTFPRYANYFDPSRQAWSGGFGWIRDRDRGETWSTYYPEFPKQRGSQFETSWGMGYARKRALHNDVEVVEDTFSPVGDDEVVLQRITITNKSGSATKNLSHYSYWDWDSLIMQGTLVAGSSPYHEDEDYQLFCDPQRQALKAAITTRGGDLNQPNDFFDPSARVAFFSLLNREMSGYEMVKDNVFPPGATTPKPDALRPNGLTRSGAACDNQPGWITYNSRDMLFVAESQVNLAPGASTTLYTLYGFARKNLDQANQPNKHADAIIDAYRTNYEGRFDQTVEHFARKSVRFTPPATAPSWLGREVAWSNYHLHAGVLREDFFGVHTLNQNSQYLLDAGQNIAPRDNVQHIQPLIYSSPDIAKETLIHILQNMKSTGELPFGSSGYGAVAAISSAPWPFGWRPSDLGLWLGLGIAEYVHVTRDFAFLDQKYPYRDSNRGNPAGWPTVYQMLQAAMRYQLDDVRTGANDLVRIRTSDWADGLTGDSGNEPKTHEEGESTFTTALAVWVYPMVRELAVRRNDTALAGRLETETNSLREALRAQWRTDKFNRAYMFDSSGQRVELGRDVFWAESNAFALLPENLLEPEKLQSMLAMLENTPGLRTPLGLNITGPSTGSGTLNVKPGYTTWYSLNGALIRGLANYAAGSDEARRIAWDELERNTLARHATVYPNMFYGLTSGSDAWFTMTNNQNPSVDVPGTSWLEKPIYKLFPSGAADKQHSINNMHSHSHLVYNTLKLAGVHANAGGYVIRPAIKPEETIGWESETFGLRYEGDRISGKIRAVSSGPVSMKVTLNQQLRAATSLSVRSGDTVLSFQRDGNDVTFQLPLTANQSTLWSIAAAR